MNSYGFNISKLEEHPHPQENQLLQNHMICRIQMVHMQFSRRFSLILVIGIITNITVAQQHKSMKTRRKVEY